MKIKEKLMSFISKNKKSKNNCQQLDTEINKAFDFYINWYQQTIENMKILRNQGKLNHISDVQFFMMQNDLSALKSKDIKTLFTIMLKKDRLEYHKLQSQISEETSICEGLCKAVLAPEYHKRPQQTIEEFIHEYRTAIMVHQDNIIRLKANDINLCDELILSDRDA